MIFLVSNTVLFVKPNNVYNLECPKYKYYFMSFDAYLNSHMTGFPSDEEYRKGSQIDQPHK